MLRLSNLSLAKRLTLLIVSACAGIFVLLSIFIVSERTLLMNERKQAVQQAVETAYGIFTYYHQQFTEGKLSEDDAKRLALASIKPLRYGTEGYFFVINMDHVLIMSPSSPDRVGKNQIDFRDARGNYMYRDFVNVVKAQDAGFSLYYFPRLGSDEALPKVGFVKGFQPWGFILGSGLYVDTVDTAVRGRAIALGLSATALAAALLCIGILISRSIVLQLGGEPVYVNAVTRRMADGDLTVDITLRNGDKSSLLHGIATMRENLTRIVSNVRVGSTTVATASAEIASGNQDLSARTESQAGALEETASSMEELGSTVDQNADNARQANQLAQSASGIAIKGGEIVSKVVEMMEGINHSSKNIVDIITVIDGIAFQTNILSLNAAVEAARAGEQGRGFAVVAGEVRNLAARSSEAAKEIKALITDSVSRVHQGSEMVQQAGTTMNEIVASIGRVTDIMGEISAASSEQSAGVSQVCQAVIQMEQGTQQNAAMVEQIAAAAASLNGEAQALVEVVSAFKINES
ncbi:MAG: cache domain-containing protein [Burkholderiaceae bacterium]|nr:cache domain-containing protein [Burkholderiaceae bacterium]